MIFNISIIYAGFHGIIVSAAGNTGILIRPIACLTQALHITLWNYCDTVNILILMLLTIDQIVSIIWSKTHNELSSQYFKMPILLLIFVISLGITVPVWHYSITYSENNTVVVPNACYFADIVYPWFYKYELELRKWGPLISQLYSDKLNNY